MNSGTENRAKVIAAIVLLVIAAVLFGSWFFSSSDTTTRVSSTPAIDEIAPPRTSGSTTHGKTNGKKSNTEARSLDPRLRFDWLKGSEDTKYSGTGRNIFQTYVEIPKPIVPPVKQNTPPIADQGPPQPPPPPPINLKFFGFASRAGEAKKIFLSEGEDIFIAGEGQIVDRRYKVLHISVNDVEIEDVLNNNRQSIPLTQG
ncbi:MAG TPA: hypothetical protein VGF44_04370 [Terriglobales bacterium]